MMTRFAGLALLLAMTAAADTLTLQDGRIVDGTFIGGNTRQIQMQIGGAIQTFAITDIRNLSFSAGQASAPIAAPAPSSPAQPDPTTPVAPAGALGVTLPAGTQFVVRMIDSVDSERDHTGQSFRASLDEPVIVSGNQIVPRGADVVVKLVDSKESGKIAGRASLTLNLQTVTINGRMVDINTQSVSQESSSRGKRTAGVAAGGAALGAIIGGIAGGGKGAAIGAGSGAGAGVGVEVLTKGQRVRIPSETRLTFSLDVPVNI